MAEQRIFQAFFSYVHDDAASDPKLIEALTVELERRVRVRLANTRFTIWRDTKGLRTGVRWDPAIETAVRASHILTYTDRAAHAALDHLGLLPQGVRDFSASRSSAEALGGSSDQCAPR